MKKFAFLFALVFSLPVVVRAQTIEKSRRVIQILPQQSVYLNGGGRNLVGGKSRVYYKIDLPQNTVEWYYIFSTAPDEKSVQTLNLVPQLMKLNPTTSVSSIALASLMTPSGVGAVDIFLINSKGVDNLMAKDMWGMWSYANPGSFKEGTIENAKQGKVRIDDITKGTYYLGLRNPSASIGVNVNLEVAAIVEETKIIEKTEIQVKAEMLGSLGWEAYQKGEYEKSFELGKRAIELDSSLGWVNNNMGLVQLIRNDYLAAIDCYSKAIVNYKKSANPKAHFYEAIKDLNNLILLHRQVEGSGEILGLLESEYKKY